MANRRSIGARGAALAVAFAAVGAAGAQASVAHAAASDVTGQAYVNENSTGVNAVAAFNRHSDGTLTPLSGSPYAIGGAGLGTGLGSQGSVQITTNGRFLLAVDAGSNQISVVHLSRSGVPEPGAATVPSGGVEPVSITISPNQHLVYVANAGSSTADGSYTGFRLTTSGRLIPRPRLTVDVPRGSALGDVLFNITGDRLVGTRDTTSLIDSFRVNRHGRLVPAAGSPFAAQSLGPIGSEFSPVNPEQVFISNAHAGAGNGTVSAFDVSRSGGLTPIGSSPFADFQTAPCWVEISHDGRFLFTVNTGSGSISSYAIAPTGALTLLGTVTLKNGAGAVDARLSPDGRYLNVTGGSAGVVSTLAVDGGRLTELASSPTPLPTIAAPAAAAPTGLAVR
jgi:6-phosphogluconolactonase